MVEKEILEMRPGAELNILVAKQIMGHEVVSDQMMGDMERFLDKEGESVWGTPLHYSEDPAIAQAVVVEMLSRGYEDAETWEDYGQGRYAPAEAICKRALMAVLSACN